VGMTSRGKLIVVVAFFGSAVLFAAAAVALVKASDDGKSPSTLPSSQPTVVFQSQSPTPTASATATTSPSASATPTPVSTASPSASPATVVTHHPSSSPRPTTSPSPLPSPLQLSAVLSQDTGDTDTFFVVAGHATVGLGKINHYVISWGDGQSASGTTGTACPAPADGDCRNFSFHHQYAAGHNYKIVLTVHSGTGAYQHTTSGTLVVKDVEPAASPSPAPTT
jgi:hypothetical protein